MHMTQCGKSVHPGAIECTYLMHKPHDCSMFDTFTANEMSSEVLPQGGKHKKGFGCQIKTVCGWFNFSNQTFAENSPLLKGPGCFLLMASHKLFNVVQYLLALNVHPGLGCPPATCPASPEI